MGIFSKSKPETQPGHYHAGPATVTCPVCEGRDFVRGKAQLNTATMSLLDLDWANKSAVTLICARCSHILWFMDEPVRTGGRG